MQGTGTKPNQRRAQASPLVRVSSWRRRTVAVSLVVLAGTGCASSETAQDVPNAESTAEAAATAIAEPATVRDAIEGEAKVIDVRTREEFANGHLKGAVSIDLAGADFDERIAALNETASYVVYCASGNRAGTAIEMMHDQGFDHLINGGGYEDLAASGLPTT